MGEGELTAVGSGLGRAARAQSCRHDELRPICGKRGVNHDQVDSGTQVAWCVTCALESTQQRQLKYRYQTEYGVSQSLSELRLRFFPFAHDGKLWSVVPGILPRSPSRPDLREACLVVGAICDTASNGNRGGGETAFGGNEPRICRHTSRQRPELAFSTPASKHTCRNSSPTDPSHHHQKAPESAQVPGNKQIGDDLFLLFNFRFHSIWNTLEPTGPLLIR